MSSTTRIGTRYARPCHRGRRAGPDGSGEVHGPSTSIAGDPPRELGGIGATSGLTSIGSTAIRRPPRDDRPGRLEPSRVGVAQPPPHVSGEDGPVAFFSGSNSASRSVSTTSERRPAAACRR